MARFRNGAVPRHLLIEDGAGNLFFPGTWRRWQSLVADVQHQHGVTLTVTPPAYGASNAYRDLEGQWSIRSALGLQAAPPGNSSHGGVWTGQTTGAGGLPTWVVDVEAGAVDVYNWSVIGWAAFKAAAERAGFITNVVVPQELWHIVDLDPWGHKNGAAGGGGGEDVMNKEQEAKLDEVLAFARWYQKRDGGSTDPKYGVPTYAETSKQVESISKRIAVRENGASIGSTFDGVVEILHAQTALLEAIRQTLGRSKDRVEDGDTLGVSLDRVSKQQGRLIELYEATLREDANGE